ncbi:uncharacterized protein [Pyrus communis]|uniref:uncharacterized protein n=1 Tax=Pyrus communis TaxID=23211 RepID=UPI0035C0004C
MVNDANEALRSAKLHIQEIRTKKFSIAKKEANPLTLDLHHAVTSLSAELYQKDIHFLMELIQNAEDNEYKEGVEPTLEFVLTKKDITGSGAPATLLVFNNEVGFSRKNMDSICSIGRSTKKGKRRQGFIGEKGIGFKSVFLVSSRPHIFSNGYQVSFMEEPNQDCGIGYIVPEWVTGKPYLSSICEVYGFNKILPTTTFILPLKPDKVEAVRMQLSELHPELLLFLSKIKHVYVRGCDPQEADDVSTISIFSETEHVNLSDKGANSRVVQLSVKEKKCDTDELCKYYLWRESFPVKPGNRVNTRMDVEEWVITLAFPFGERLRRGTSSVGVFSFLPTAMVTNLPFVIQADFILASSRESILLDDVWNLGILECVPSAFMNAFQSCVRELSLFPSPGQAFEFLPAQASPIPTFDDLRESIRVKLEGLQIVPCQMLSGGNWLFLQPKHAVRILPKFRALVLQMKSEGAFSSGSPLLKRVLHSSLDLEKYSAVLYFLGVVWASGHWYTECIRSCNLLMVSDDVYIDLLDFIADNEVMTSKHISVIPLIKYINREGNLQLCTITKTAKAESKIQYAEEKEVHTWLNKCNMEFGCPDNMYFLPDNVQKALLDNQRSVARNKKSTHGIKSSVCNWLCYYAGVKSCTAYDYAVFLCNHVNKEPGLALTLANFLYHAHKKSFLSDYETSYLCGSFPLIDGTDRVRMQRAVTLVPASGSKWVKLFGSQNPFVEQNYVDIGNAYAKSSMFLGDSVLEKELLNFIERHSKAMDLPELSPPDVVLEKASHELSSEQAFLLLDWIRLLRTKGSSLPTKFIESIRGGKWMKTYSGYSSPRKAILPDEAGKSILDMMKHVLKDVCIIDLEFYMNRINLYQDELKFLGVGHGSDDVRKLVTNCLKSLASPRMSKDCAFSLLNFISICRGRNVIDKDWLTVMKEKKWLKTHQGYSAPKGSMLLPSEIEVEACLKITNLPIVDETFYGSRLGSFISELTLLGVACGLEEVQKSIAENMNLTSNLSSMTGSCGLLILKCIRCLGSGAAGLINRIKCQPWMKTNLGFKRPSETALPGSQWGSLFTALQVPAIDALYYGDAITHFVEELNALDVVVDDSGASKMIAVQFNSLVSSSNLAPSTVMSLLGCIRELSQTMSLSSPELMWLTSEKWLKTRHGYKTPRESILFSSKWGSISFFVDLPLIDDAYYGIDIYKFRGELQILGVIMDFEQGASFVAKGVRSPIEGELLSADGMMSILECIKHLMSSSLDEALVGDLVGNVAKGTCLKTLSGYKTPEECVLFDPTWDCILKRSDVPSIDEFYFGTNIHAYKNQLRDIGVKVDPLDVCSFLSAFLLSQTKTAVIRRIYSFLNKFKWSPTVQDKCNSQVWIPNPEGTGVWVNSQDCVLHDWKNLFGSCLFCLDKFYKKELLPVFSSAFGVSDNPSINNYVQLWNNWALRDKCQVTVRECSSFCEYIVDNWNQDVEENLKLNLIRLPATMSTVEEIYLMSREEVFIADDLQLKKIFSSFDKAPLFVWIPNSFSEFLISPRRLHQIYELLGVRKVSDSVECNVSSMLSVDHCEKVDARNGLIGRGLIKIILGFLAGPEVNMSMKERHNAAKSMVMLSVYKSDKPIQVCYRLVPSASTSVEVEKLKLVLWEKDSQRLLMDKSGYENGKDDLEFVTSFADELAQGLLAQAKPTAADTLSKIIQIGFMFHFNENEVDFLLMKQNLERLVEDVAFLDSAFLSSEGPSRVYRKRASKKLELVAPSTPMLSGKKRRQ